jgi:hypothetical protein
MRYRIYASPEADQQLFQSEDELIEALSSRGWELQQRAAAEVVERRERRRQSFDAVATSRSVRPRAG